MHILYLHQYFVPPDGSGGTRSYEMAKRFVAAGHQVTVLTTSAFFPSSYQLITGTNYLKIEGIEVHVLHDGFCSFDFAQLNRPAGFSPSDQPQVLTSIPEYQNQISLRPVRLPLTICHDHRLQ